LFAVWRSRNAGDLVALRATQEDEADVGLAAAFRLSGLER
jgi:hypothetical protein